MGINVGEVEAVLAARDTMSPALVSAAEKVRQLRGELATMGPQTRENAEAFSRLTNSLATAENAFRSAAQAQEHQAEVARKVAERTEQLAAAQTKQAASASTVTNASATVTAALGTQSAAVDRLTAANEASLASMVTRFSALTAQLGVHGFAGKPNVMFDEAVADHERLRTAIRAMTSESRVASIEQQALSQSAAAVAAKSVNAAAGVRELGEAAEVSSRKMGQMEGFTARLLEYFLLMTAIRFSAQFIVDLFAGADALTRMNDRTQLSLGLLQELQYGASATGTEFEKVETAVDNFDKKLAKMSMTTSDALKLIKLDFSTLFNMPPDQRLDAVFKGINELPSQLQRTRVEVELFGSEALDTMIKRYEGLKAAAAESNAILGDDQIRTLAYTSRAWRDLGIEVKETSGKFVVAVQDMIAALASPMFGGGAEFAKHFPLGRMLGDNSPDADRFAAWRQFLLKMSTGGIYGATGDMFQSMMTEPPADIKLPPRMAPSHGPGGETPPLGQAFIDSLKANAQPISPDLRSQLDQLRAMNELTADNAARLRDQATGASLTSEQFKAYQKSVQDAGKASSAYSQELRVMEAEQEKVNALWARAIQMSEQEGELGIEAKLQRNEAGRVQQLTEALNQYSNLAQSRPKLIPELEETYAQKVYAINTYWDEKGRVDREANNKKELEHFVRNAEDINKIRDQSFAASAEINLRGIDLQMAQLDKQEQIEKDSWSKRMSLGQVGVAQYWEAIGAIDDKYENERARRAAAWEFNKWEQIGQIDEQAIAVEISMAGDALSTRLALNQKEYDARVSALSKQGKLDQDYLDHLDRLYTAKAQSIILSFDPLWKAYQALNQDMRQEWAQTWEVAFHDTDKFVNAIAAPFLSMERQFQSMIAAMIADWQYMLLEPLLSSFKTWAAGMFGVSPTSTPFTSGLGGPGSQFGSMFGPQFGNGFFPGMSSAPYFQYGGRTTSTVYPFAGDYFGSMGTQGYMPMPGQAPYVQAHDPRPSFPSMIGAGMFVGAGAAMQGGSPGSQLGSAAMMSAGVGVTAAMTAGTVTAGIIAGAVTLGVGAAVIGAIVLIKSMMKGVEDDIARDAGEKFGQRWSDGLQKTIVERAKKVFHDEVAAEIASLPDIMKEHPVTAENLAMYEEKVRDIFVMIGEGHFTTEQAAMELNEVFPQLAAAATDAYGRIDAKLKDIIKLNGEYGTQSKAIAEWLKQQATSLGTNIPELVTAVTRRGGSVDEQGARDLAEQVKMAFAAMVASGMDPREVLAQLGGSIEAVRKAYARLGIEVDDAALRQLFMINKINQRNPELLAGLDALIRSMINFSNLNLETASLFASQERTGVGMWEKIRKAVIAAGGTEAEALGLIQDMLHEMVLEAENLGVPLSEDIQLLIAASKEAGVWQDAWTPKRTMMDALTELINSVQRLIDKLNGVSSAANNAMSASARAAAAAAAAAAAGRRGGSGAGGGNDTDEGPIREASGGYGYVDRPTTFLAGDAGGEYYAFSGANRPMLGPNAVSGFGSGSGGGGNTYHVTVKVDAPGAFMGEYWPEEMAEKLDNAIWNRFANNQGVGQSVTRATLNLQV